MTNNFITTFHSLPINVRNWLASERFSYIVRDINSKLGLRDERRSVIARYVAELVMKKLGPLDFVNELSHELNVSFQTAKSITADIENSVLKPIENELRNDLGIDIKLIDFGQPGPSKRITDDEEEEDDVINDQGDKEQQIAPQSVFIPVIEQQLKSLENNPTILKNQPEQKPAIQSIPIKKSGQKPQKQSDDSIIDLRKLS